MSSKIIYFYNSKTKVFSCLDSCVFDKNIVNAYYGERLKNECNDFFFVLPCVVICCFALKIYSFRILMNWCLILIKYCTIFMRLSFRPLTNISNLQCWLYHTLSFIIFTPAVVDVCFLFSSQFMRVQKVSFKK